MAKRTNKPASIDNLNVWVTCKIQIINEDTWKYQTIDEVPWTPKHIKQAMKKHKLASAWIWVMGDRELKFASEYK